MSLRLIIPILVGVAWLFVAALTLGILYFLSQNIASDDLLLFIIISAGLFFLLSTLIMLVLWVVIYLKIINPIYAVKREIETVIHSTDHKLIDKSDKPLISDLVDSCNNIIDKLHKSQDKVLETISNSVKQTREQMGYLESILININEGIIVCNLEHQILLYNNSVRSMVDDLEKLGLGRLVFHSLTKEPIKYTFRKLITYYEEEKEKAKNNKGYKIKKLNTLSFVTSSIESHNLINAKMSLIFDADDQINGYVISLSDVSEQIGELNERTNLLKNMFFDLPHIMANLKISSEAFKKLKAKKKNVSKIEEIVFSEIDTLYDKLNLYAVAYRSIPPVQWNLSQFHSSDLIKSIINHMNEDNDHIKLTLTGTPHLYKGDTHYLHEVIYNLILQMHENYQITNFDLEANASDRFDYLDIIWEGSPITDSKIQKFKEQYLESIASSPSIGHIIEFHHGDIWSVPYIGARSMMRIAIAAYKNRDEIDQSQDLPERPEFYDFDIFTNRNKDDELLNTPLRNLNLVVFDTETTGLRPSKGDEIISIGAIRIVNGRIITGECFDRLVNPQRNIPEVSIKFHGITEDMVKDKPPAAIILKQFKNFIGNSVLMAHNAAFDMKFLELKEDAIGEKFDNMVIDLLLLSAFLHDHTTDHSLGGLAHRMNVEEINRHSALGDAFTTADIFIKMLDPLDSRGVKTLGDAIRVSNEMVEIRKEQEKF